jgi:hypothetical protein
VRGKVYLYVEINLKGIKESKQCSNVIAEFGIGNAAVSRRPAAQVGCLVRFLFASKEGGLETYVK